MSKNRKRGRSGRHKKKRKIIVSRLLIVILVPILVLAIIGQGYNRLASRPVDKKATTSMVVSIPEGSSATKIAEILKDKKLIRNEWIFVSAIKETKRAHEIKSGKYKLSKNMTNEQIIDKILRGDVYEDGIKITIPEGSVSTEIVDKLIKSGLGTRKKYVELFRKPKMFSDKFTFLNNPRIKTLEGFLYPETYFFSKDSTEKEIFTTMINTFNKNYNKSIRADVEKNHFDFYDTIIMASIVEKESVNDSDRAIIAGVFYNRLSKNMKLQSDAVLQYGLPERKSRVMYKDLKVETPYNLYLHKGLPPTPVANPGIKSLEAAANPKKTEYLYFVTGVDGKNAYSKTFEEHKKHAQKYHDDLDALEKKK